MPANEPLISAQDSAWHRQPTMWIVLGVLAFTFVSSGVLLYLAVTNPPELIDKTAVSIKAPAGGPIRD